MLIMKKSFNNASENRPLYCTLFLALRTMAESIASETISAIRCLKKLFDGPVLDPFGEPRLTVQDWINLPGEYSLSGKRLASQFSDIMPYHPEFWELSGI